MTHRAEQIVQRCAELVATAVAVDHVTVFTHRRLTLSADDADLPAISVDYGEDTRADTVIIGSISSELQVQFTGVVADAFEDVVRQKLMALRSSVHAALKADSKLGLGFVIDTYYGGANAPEVVTESEQIIGALTSTWIVYYQMNEGNPSN